MKNKGQLIDSDDWVSGFKSYFPSNEQSNQLKIDVSLVTESLQIVLKCIKMANSNSSPVLSQTGLWGKLSGTLG